MLQDMVNELDAVRRPMYVLTCYSGTDGGKVYEAMYADRNEAMRMQEYARKKTTDTSYCAFFWNIEYLFPADENTKYEIDQLIEGDKPTECGPPECVGTVPAEKEFPPEMYEDDYVPQTEADMRVYWGEKCSTNDPECPVCAAWAEWELAQAAK